ncbi:hypothetical protein ACFC34_38190 [Streptomyces sp. NPDC056053]|uniref:hypothetical protein n=1 Tax=Streptomyces sp. NPDC056053 TaxID=3345696 RepID=UPI0035D93B72
MSAELYRAVRCDGTDAAGERCDTEWSHPVAVDTFAELRRHLRERGWRRRAGHDLCPEHASGNPVSARAETARDTAQASRPGPVPEGGKDQLHVLELASEFRIPVPDTGAGGHAEIVVHRERGGTGRWAVTDGALTGRQAWVEGQGWQYISEIGRTAAYAHPRDEALLLALRVAGAEAARRRTETAAL